MELCISLPDIVLEKKDSIAYIKNSFYQYNWIHSPAAEDSHSALTEICISVCAQQKGKLLCFASFSPAYCCVQYSM